jgi:predicted NBD/HSP70 family sugar kinase
VNLINPEAVVPGGGVIMDGELLLPAIDRHLRAQMSSRANRGLRFLPTAPGYDAALPGAAAVALAAQGM